MGGDAKITGNFTGSGSSQRTSNVYLPENFTIDISTETPLTTGASIGVSTFIEPTVDTPVTISGAGSNDYNSYFFSDSDYYRVTNSGTGENQVLQLMTVPTYTISGTVTGSDTGAGIVANVQLTTIDGTSIGSPVTTATSGTYTLSGVLPGNYKVTASSTGYQTTSTDTVTVISADVSAIDLTLVRIIYEFDLSESGTVSFTAKPEGYSSADSQSITVENVGKVTLEEVTIALSGANADSFTLSKNSITNLARDASDTFSVSPKIGLSEGTYTATVSVSEEHCTTKSFTVSFTVEADQNDDPDVDLDTWHSDATGHWHEDQNGTVIDFSAHTEGRWIVDYNPTTAYPGRAHRVCSVCGYTIRTMGIPQLEPEPIKITKTASFNLKDNQIISNMDSFSVFYIDKETGLYYELPETEYSIGSDGTVTFERNDAYTYYLSTKGWKSLDISDKSELVTAPTLNLAVGDTGNIVTSAPEVYAILEDGLEKKKLRNISFVSTDKTVVTVDESTGVATATGKGEAFIVTIILLPDHTAQYVVTKVTVK